jgi:manganese/zinc/iron transport system permease protein
LDLLIDLFIDPNSRWILLGCSLLGLSSGVIGCFAYLRRQTLIGDALAHASLPGICIAFLITGTKSLFLFLISAGLSGFLATASISAITRHSKLKQDSALGIVLSVFFGIGIVLLTLIQRTGNGNQSGLDHFIFGRAASMIISDVWVMMGVSLCVMCLCALFFKELKIVSFDVSYTRSLGYSVGFLNKLIMFLIVLTVVSGIQAVGVVLIVALLITPAISARYWTDKLHTMLILSGLFGASSGFIGTFISSLGRDLPTGPLCVLASFFIFLCSFMVAPKKGIFAKKWKRLSMKKQWKQSSS